MERAEKLVPAQLAYLAIFCPRLGKTEVTFRHQAVFYYSRQAKSKRRHKARDGTGADSSRAERELQDQDNEKLRQIGLAQAMVDFAENFSAGKPVESIESEKSRAIIHQLEKGWWVVASVDLMRIPVDKNVTATASAAVRSEAQPSQYEYSSREVAPPALLTHQIDCAQSLFAFHHGRKLDDLLLELGRTQFCYTLDKHWTQFASTWDVNLHGSPSVDIFKGLKLAAGGELGIGVGEEEWGSGEREVLEHFASGTEGLIDLFVSRYGDPASLKAPLEGKDATDVVHDIWLGNGGSPNANDGVVFSGTGALQAEFVCTVANWTNSIYTYGSHAYGVMGEMGPQRRLNADKQLSSLPRKPSDIPDPMISVADKNQEKAHRKQLASGKLSHDRPSIPPSIVGTVENSSKRASSAAKSPKAQNATVDSGSAKAGFADPQIWMNVLTLGYGSSWTFSGKDEAPQTSQDDHVKKSSRARNTYDSETKKTPRRTPADLADIIKRQQERESKGFFLIGYQGDLMRDEHPPADLARSDGDNKEHAKTEDSQILEHKIHVLLSKKGSRKMRKKYARNKDLHDKIALNSGRKPKKQCVRVIVFIHRPFIYTLLFDPDTPSLAQPAFYSTLHNYLSPLHKPLTLHTAPSQALLRVQSASIAPHTSPAASSLASNSSNRPIYDLIYNPASRTITCSLPNIPELGALSVGSRGEKWSRLDALNVHGQILGLRGAAMGPDSDVFERLVKTGRGWWVMYMRTTTTVGADLDVSDDEEGDEMERNSSDWQSQGVIADQTEEKSGTVPHELDNHEQETSRHLDDISLLSSTSASKSTESSPVSSSIREAILVRRARDHVSERSEPSLFGFGGRRTDSRSRPSRLVEGIGVDARKYVEGLLSFGR